MIVSLRFAPVSTVCIMTKAQDVDKSAARLLSLPVEIQQHMFMHFSFLELGPMKLACREIHDLLSTTFFTNHLLREAEKPRSEGGLAAELDY